MKEKGREKEREGERWRDRERAEQLVSATANHDLTVGETIGIA